MNRVSTDSRKALMIQLLRDQPNLRPKESCAAFQERYNMPVEVTTYYHARKAISNGYAGVSPKGSDRVSKAPGTKGPDRGPLGDSDPPPMRPAVAGAEGPGLFISHAVLENVAPIKKACDSAGGLETAKKLAEVIQRAGGVDNFLAAVELLRRINEPTA